MPLDDLDYIKVSSQARKRINRLIDTAYACGDWDSTFDHPYSVPHRAKMRAKTALLKYISALEAKEARCPRG